MSPREIGLRNRHEVAGRVLRWRRRQKLQRAWQRVQFPLVVLGYVIWACALIAGASFVFLLQEGGR